MVEKTISRLEQKRAQLVDLISSLGEEQLDLPLDGHGELWTIRQTITHLLNAEGDHARVATVIARGESDRLPRDFELDAYNQSALEKRGRMGRDDLLEALAAQRERTLALASRLTEEELAIRGPHPALGEMSVGDILRVIGVHEAMHLRDIRAALERHGELPT